MDMKQWDLLELEKLPYGGFIVHGRRSMHDGGCRVALFASNLAECLEMIQRLATFEDGLKSNPKDTG
jgi:hypothetical protein